MKTQDICELIMDNRCESEEEAYQVAFYKIDKMLAKEICNNLDKYNCNKFMINDLLYLNDCPPIKLPDILIIDADTKLTEEEQDIIRKYNIPIFIIKGKNINEELINNIKRIVYNSRTDKNLLLLSSKIKEIEDKYANCSDKSMLVDGIINDVLKLFRSKDIITFIHIINLSRYVDIFQNGLDSKISDEELAFLKRAALLHDFGKLIIPNQILKKPDRLNSVEIELIKRHVSEEVYLFKNELMLPFKNVILHHHERYDGYGYNKGLKGDEIPLSCQIISLLDAFEAMTGNRNYIVAKKTIADILQEIKNNAGSQFNPELVDIFLKGSNFLREGNGQKLA